MNGSSGQAAIVNGVVAPQDAPFLQANQSAVSGVREFREALDVAAAKEKNIELKQLDREPLRPASACGSNAQANNIRVSPIETQDAALESWESQGTDGETYELLDSRLPEAYVSGKQLPAMDRQSLPVDVQFAGSGHVTSENDRILFENEEVGVAHSIVHFANDSDSEAVLSFMRFKDGQIISMETGATPLSDNYKLVGQD